MGLVTHLNPILPPIRGVDPLLGNKILSSKISTDDLYIPSDIPRLINFQERGNFSPFARVEYPDLMKCFLIANQEGAGYDHLALIKATEFLLAIPGSGIDVKNGESAQIARREGDFRFDHPNVLTAFAMSEDNDYVYIAMDFINGCSLDKVLESLAILSDPQVCAKNQNTTDLVNLTLAKLPEAQKAELRRTLSFIVTKSLIGISDALDALGKKGIIHNDLSPNNIMLKVQEDGTIAAILIDFEMYADANHKVYCRNLGYSSLEQRVGGDLTPKADVFGLSAILYEVLAGRNPFFTNTDFDIQNRADEMNLEIKITERVLDPDTSTFLRTLEQVGVKRNFSNLIISGLGPLGVNRPTANEFKSELAGEIFRQ